MSGDNLLTIIENTFEFKLTDTWSDGPLFDMLSTNGGYLGVKYVLNNDKVDFKVETTFPKCEININGNRNVKDLQAIFKLSSNYKQLGDSKSVPIVDHNTKKGQITTGHVLLHQWQDEKISTPQGFEEYAEQNGPFKVHLTVKGRIA